VAPADPGLAVNPVNPSGDINFIVLTVRTIEIFAALVVGLHWMNSPLFWVSSPQLLIVPN